MDSDCCFYTGLLTFHIVSLCMDGLHSNCFLAFDDEAVALACTDLALKLHGAQVPLDSHSKKSWRKAICSNTEWSLIKLG